MSIRRNPIAYLALFIALGGTSFAATQLPANSVGTGQLAFPLGVASRSGPTVRRIPVSVCPPGERCPPPIERLLGASVQVSLKRSSKVVVLGTAGFDNVKSKAAPTLIDIGTNVDGTIVDERYRLGVPPIIPFWFTEYLPAGQHTITLVASALSASGPRRNVYVYGPQVAVIALPPLR